MHIPSCEMFLLGNFLDFPESIIQSESRALVTHHLKVGKEMKTSIAESIAVGIMVLVGGTGIGIAQAGGTHTPGNASGSEYRVLPDVANAPEEDMDQEPVYEVTNAPEEDRDEQPVLVANTPGMDMITTEPIGAGTLPSGRNADTDDADSQDQGIYSHSIGIDDIDSRDQGELEVGKE